MCIFSYTRQNFGNDTSDDDPEENESKIYGHEEIIVRSSFATFLQKMIPQFESEVSVDFFLIIVVWLFCYSNFPLYPRQKFMLRWARSAMITLV